MSNNRKWIWLLVFAAALVIMLTGGLRMSLGLFVQPLLNQTGLTMASISFAMATCQLMWGISQPVSGALSDRFGPYPVLLGGTLILVIGCIAMPLLVSDWGLILTIGVLIAVGTGCGSFSILMGIISNRVSPDMRGIASGMINAGNSLGQFIFAPFIQFMILTPFIGWQGAMYVLAGISLLALPLVRFLAGNRQTQSTLITHPTEQSEQRLSQAVIAAFKNRSYIFVHIGFLTCGFHIAFLVTHLPTEIKLFGMQAKVASWTLALIGLSNIFGSLFVGWCVGRWRSKYILFWMYTSRVLLIGIYLLAPKTAMTFYCFALGLGFTWLATVSPTAATVSKLFGVRYLATLFGLTLLSHQIGAFFGAYLGGLVVEHYGNYEWMWYIDMVLAGLAALLSLPIKEPKMGQ
ncbi:MFS transporter [uncultured Actinobacillus sp.]|uniref:MFS transporter n=1 Tax=uncultured Actinobacillus sp. TaxID=417616 RepID=UPI0025D1FCA4|nr:MFS transporter [uncultured Actinobacillus sp.]